MAFIRRIIRHVHKSIASGAGPGNHFLAPNGDFFTAPNGDRFTF